MLNNNSNSQYKSEHLVAHEHLYSKYRADIDGLRAIAVLSVVLFHAFPNLLTGGFVGVDIFFVISGFLISTIIFENNEKNNFSFVEFYARRIRRIFPALLIVLIACFSFGWYVLISNEFKQLGKHIAGGAGFISNFLFWNESSYFDNDAETKPLLHLWSLGIEEQFYIIWPLFLFIAWKKRINLFTTCISLFIFSFLFNIINVQNDGTKIFYSPFSRFWELLVGAITAWIMLHKVNTIDYIKNKFAPVVQKIVFRDQPEGNNSDLRNLVSALGIFLVILGISIIKKSDFFPGYFALLPTIGTALIILSGKDAWINRAILSNPIFVFFGLISFPLYLWHWPMLSFARIIEGETPSEYIRIIIVLISILLAWITYKFIEKPVRYGGYGKVKAIAFLLLMFVCGYVGFNVYQQDGLDFRKISKQYDKELEKEFFFNSTLGKSSTASIMLIGDSHAEHLVPGIINEFGRGTVANYSEGGCIPFRDVDRYDSRSAPGYCIKRINKALNYFENNKEMKTIIISNMGPVWFTGETFKGMENGRTNGLRVVLNKQENITDKWEILSIGLRNTLTRLISKNKNVIFVIDIPELGFHPINCFVSRLSFLKVKEPCAVSRIEYDNRSVKYKEVVYSVLEDFPQVKVFDASKALCDKKWCWAIKDGINIYRDPDHLSDDGSKYIAKFLAPIIKTFDTHYQVSKTKGHPPRREEDDEQNPF